MSRRLFSADSLEGLVRVGDRRQFSLGDEAIRDVLEATSNSLLAGAVSLANFKKGHLKGKPCVSYPGYDAHLLLRSISQQLRRRFRVASGSRDELVRGLIESLLDATPAHVVRRDIRSFYETIPTSYLKARLAGDTAIPPIIRRYFNDFFSVHCPDNDHIGIPRGTPISPLLADIVLQDFDAAIRAAPGVFRYCRFADDIVVLTTESPAALAQLMEQQLPQPMVFNRTKKSYEVELEGKDAPGPPATFEYLGYHFTATQTAKKRDSRVVDVRLSDQKLKRLKSRILLALRSHSHSPDWTLLIDRIRFLTANHRVMRGRVVAAKDSPYISSGLFYNYRACGSYSHVAGEFKFTAYDCRELKAIDGFYHSALKGLNPQPQSNILAQLRRLSFNRSYQLKIHWNFDLQRLADIKRCWRNQ